MAIANQLKNPQLFRQQCYIDGTWVSADDAATLSVTDPATGKIIGTVPNCGKIETQRAIAAAHTAWQTWRHTTPKERAQILLNWYRLILAYQEDLALIMTHEQGKPLAQARNEITYGASFVEWFAEEGKRAYGDIIPAPLSGQHLLVIKQPIGVVAAITPWNFPSAMILRKCAPALAAGCTIIVKAASETPFSALALAELATQAGIPKGILNILTGNAQAIGTELTQNHLVRKLSFTGSTAVGKVLMRQSADTVKKISLELGGNAPFIVFNDADIDAAVNGAIASKFRNTGQTCVCANRFLVHTDVHDSFVKKLVAALPSLTVGNGLDKSTHLGPLINLAAVTKVEQHITDAQTKGAKLIYGGKRHTLGGSFFEPTVLIAANDQMLVAREETFGPLAPIFRFETDDQAIALANATEFGLAAYFYSRDIHRVWRIAEALEYGMVGINTGIISNEVAPFGGIKESGIGREGSKYGLLEYLEIKYLCMGGAS